MKIGDYVFLREEPLKNHTSVKIGGVAKCLIIPLSKNALVDLIKRCQRKELEYVLLGNCSNVLVGDNYHDKIFIKNVKACSQIAYNGIYVSVGSSLSLNKLVSFCIKRDLFGMEFLYYVPGTVGGAIYMNAGRGENHNLSISNYIVSVEVFDGEKIFHLTREQCDFGYRESIFQKKHWIILSCVLKLSRQDYLLGRQAILRRREFIKNSQDLEYPSAGTIFKRNFILADQLKGFRIGGAQYSLTAPSFIINVNNASFEDVMGLINHAKSRHKEIYFREPDLEVIILE